VFVYPTVCMLILNVYRTYGACCVDDLGAKALGCDLLGMNVY